MSLENFKKNELSRKAPSNLPDTRGGTSEAQRQVAKEKAFIAKTKKKIRKKPTK